MDDVNNKPEITVKSVVYPPNHRYCLYKNIIYTIIFTENYHINGQLCSTYYYIKGTKVNKNDPDFYLLTEKELETARLLYA